MKTLLLGLVILTSFSIFANYDLKILDRVTFRLELAKDYESPSCIQDALSFIENEISSARIRHGENFDAYDEQIFREDLQMVARVNIRNCMALE